ncbi:hypothetical protein PR048_029434 [Dryococelus australis]|uniref:Uncharacterized protein n=1 Tax=Dryococelus australis TaxID=614101 RepID=A0ABQ9GDC6_9NEOP|nr:hypothetical protein PR048_029434 [Dryococelus australis]
MTTTIARSEKLVQLITTHKGYGLVNKLGLMPVDHLAITLTKPKEGKCRNTNSEALIVNKQRNEREKLSLILRLEHSDEYEKQCIRSLCREYVDIFHLPGDKLTCTTEIEHSIPTLDDTLVNVKPY